VTSLVGYLQNNLYAEMALMFKGESGGIALYANEGWKKYFSLAGPLATFGYWLGWSLTLGVVGETVGSLVQAQWFTSQTWAAKAGPVSFSFPQLIAVGLIALGWAVNVLGIRIASIVVRACSVAFVLFLALVVLAPVVAGDFHPSRLTWHPGSVMAMFVWMYAAAWTVYSTEICATFAPEYRNEQRDTTRSLRYSGLLVLAVFVLVPVVSGGMVGEAVIAKNPITFTVNMLSQAYGTWITDAALLVIIAELVLTMISSSADGGRVVFAMARNGLTIRQFDRLNRFNEPWRALTLDLVVNTLIVIAVSSPVAILLAANFAYMIAVILAVSAFLLLRRDRPNAKRPIRLGKHWVAVAWLLLVFDLALTFAGITHPGLAGYGSASNTWFVVVALVIAVALYYVRIVVQDKRPFQWRSTDAERGEN
jgi:amino acid transporter